MNPELTGRGLIDLLIPVFRKWQILRRKMNPELTSSQANVIGYCSRCNAKVVKAVSDC